MRVVLYAGKGGVGKTTLAAATASALSADGYKTLVVSTDPAHSLGDALDVPLGSEAVELEGGLWGAQIQTRALIDDSWEPLRDHLATLLAGAGVDEVLADELTVLPGVEELFSLCEVHRLASTGMWDVVIVDCAPTAESLRLLALPEAAAGYLERLFPTHRRLVRGLLAGIAGTGTTAARWDAAADAIGRLAEELEGLRRMLADQATTSVRLVLTPERVVAAETRRSIGSLALQGIRVDAMLANRLVPDPPPSARGAAASWMRTRRKEQEAVLSELRQDLPGVSLVTVEYRAQEPVGRSALLEVAGELLANGTLDLDDDTGFWVPLLAVEHLGGTGLESSYELRISIPLVERSDVDISRMGDQLAVTLSGYRRLILLPSVLRRCTVADAEIAPGRLLVRFQPDPSLWMK